MPMPRPLQIFLFFCLLTAAGVLASPPLALLLGLGIGLLNAHPYPRANGPLVKQLLQFSVVGLGFGMNLQAVLKASQTGLLMAAFTIIATLILAFGLGKLLKIERKTAHLIGCGTAICGGSAIAAVAPVLNANDQEISVSLGTIFILNAVALLVFPPIGHALGLSQAEFGLWSAIAIHDTSSVVGAASRYGNEALMLATTVKLARALWIVPVTLLSAWLFQRQSARVNMPYFIVFFLLASVLHTYVAPVALVSPWLVDLAKLGLTLTLFLIGAGLSLKALRQVGIQPLLHGVLLWLFIAGLSLGAIVFVSGHASG